MDKQQILKLYTEEQRKSFELPGWKREATENVIRHVSLSNESGFVLYSKLDENSVETAINEQLDYFQEIGQSFEWKVFDYDMPTDLKDRLGKKGFLIQEPEALMILDVEQAGSMITYPISNNLKLITEDKEIDEIMELEDKVWNTSHNELGARLKRELASDGDPLFIYAIYNEGIPVSAAWMFLHTGTSFASFFGGSTLKEYRGKGYYTSLLAARMRTAQQLGFRYITVDASPMSKPILENHGFHCLAYSYPCMSPEIKK